MSSLDYIYIILSIHADPPSDMLVIYHIVEV